MYRFAKAYKDQGEKYISKKLLLRSSEIVEKMGGIKTIQTKQLCVRSILLMANTVCGYHIKIDFKYRIEEKKLVPYIKFLQLVKEVREEGLPAYRNDPN